MKWIGQHIQSLISRFRSDVYLDNPTAGGSDPDKFLGIDSNGKIIYRTGHEVLSDIGAGTGDITGITITADDAGTATDDSEDLAITVSGGQGIDTSASGSTLEIACEQASTSNKGVVELATSAETNTGTDTNRVVTPDGLEDWEGSEQVTTLGTIATGVWQGDGIASAYLDADTAHLSGTQTFTGTKTFDNTISGAIDGQAATVATIAGLAPNTATTQATQPNIDSIGTDGDTLDILGDRLDMINTTTGMPTLNLYNKTDDVSGPFIYMANTRFDSSYQDGEDNDVLGTIIFRGYDDGTPSLQDYAKIYSNIHDATSGEESGRLFLQVANHDGGLGSGLILTGGSENDEIDVTVGLGDNSVTAVSGSLRPKGQIVLMRAAFKDDIGTTKHYIPLQSELEQTTATHEMNSFVSPYPGKLLKVMYRGSGNFSGGTFSFTLEKIKKDGAFATGGNLSTLETITGTGPTNNATDPNMITLNFVGGSGTNAFAAGDNIMVGIQSDTDVTAGTSKHFFTLVFEFDFSGLA